MSIFHKLKLWLFRRQKYDYKRSRINHKVVKAAKNVREFHWKYKNLIALLVSAAVSLSLIQNPAVIAFFEQLGTYGYVGGFVVGLFYTYAISTPFAAASIYIMGKSADPFLLAIVASFGALISDYIIFRFVRDRLMAEINLAAEKLKIPSGFFRKLFSNKLFLKFAPVLAGMIIASPLPDELAIALFAAVKYDPKYFAIFSYGSNFIGIFIIAWLGSSL